MAKLQKCFPRRKKKKEEEIQQISSSKQKRKTDNKVEGRVEIDDDEEDVSQPKRKTGNKGKERVEIDDDEEEDVSQPKRKTGNKGKARIESDDEEEEEEEDFSRRTKKSDDEEEEEEEEYEDSDEFEPRKRKRKRRVKNDDPFRVPANKHTQETFLATNPFLDEEEMYIPTYCRFDPDLKMNPETLMTIMGVCIEQYSKFSRAFPSAETELENRIKLMTDIRNFTAVSGPEPEKARTLEAQDMKVSYEDEEAPVGTSSSNKSMHADHEKSEGSSFRTDFRIYVQDVRALWIKQLLPRELWRLIRRWRLSIIAEAKGRRELDAIYQGIASSQHQLLKNFKSGHVDPVYPLVITPMEWMYSMLDVEGLVEVGNKRITRESYEGYCKTARLHYSRVLKKQDVSSRIQSYAILQEQLLTRIQGFKAYRDGWYMVGRLFKTKKWYLLPRCDEVSGSITHGVKMFYEGLCRIVIGERVLSWKKEDAEAAAMARDRVEAEIARYSGVETSRDLAPYYRFMEGLPDKCREEITSVLRRYGKY